MSENTVSRRGLRFLPWALLILAVALSALSSTAWQAVIGVVSDDYSQIALGRQIVSDGIPDTDTLSWTSDEISPTLHDHEWLYQVALAKAYDIGGFRLSDALWTLVRFLIFACVAALAWSRGRAAGLWLPVAVVSVSGALMAIYQTTADRLISLSTRPQTLSIAILLVMAVLLEYGKGKGWFRWLCLPLAVLAANLHGGFWPMHAMVLGYYAIRHRDLAPAIAALGLMANPYGASVLALPFAYYGTGVAELGPEWARTPLWPGDDAGIVAAVSFGLVLAAVHLRRPEKAIDLIFLVAGLGVALSAQRAVFLVPLLLLPLASEGLAALPERLKALLPGDLSTPVAIGLMGVVVPLIVTSSLLAANVATASTRPARQDLPNRTVSEGMGDVNAALDWAEGHGAERVFNTLIPTGDYMTLRGMRPFIYNRSDVFFQVQPDGKRLWSEYWEMKDRPSSVERLVDKYGAEWVLDETTKGVADYLKGKPERFEPVFSSGDVVLYRVLP